MGVEYRKVKIDKIRMLFSRKGKVQKNRYRNSELDLIYQFLKTSLMQKLDAKVQAMFMQ